MTGLLELSSAQAWPSLESATVLGWTCRWAQGYTQRANSCLPLDTPEAETAHRVFAVEEYYARQGQPALFKVPEEVPWTALDHALGERRYIEVTPSRVLSKPAAERPVGVDFCVAPAFDERWWSGYQAAAALPASHVPTALLLGDRVARPVVARVRRDGADAAWGFASLVGDQAWIFNVVVDDRWRRQGCATVLMQGLETHARRLGARALHLQVLANNAPANALYEGLGFFESYRYHYRRQPSEPPKESP